MEFKTKKVHRDRKKHFLIIKELICPEDIAIINVYALKNRTSQYMKQKQMEIKEDINNSTKVVRNFNNPLSIINKMRRQKINKKPEDLNNTINQLRLTDIYRIFLSL